MKLFLMLLFIFGITTVCYADRVCLVKSTGKFIEYQSGNAPLGTLIKNAEISGYDKNDVEEKYITEQEWQVIKNEQITQPALEKIALAKQTQKDKEFQEREQLKSEIKLELLEELQIEVIK